MRKDPSGPSRRSQVLGLRFKVLSSLDPRALPSVLDTKGLFTCCFVAQGPGCGQQLGQLWHMHVRFCTTSPTFQLIKDPCGSNTGFSVISLHSCPLLRNQA